MRELVDLYKRYARCRIDRRDWGKGTGEEKQRFKSDI